VLKAVDLRQAARPVKTLVLSVVFVYAAWMAHAQYPLYRAGYTEGRQLATFLAEVESTRATLAPGESADFFLPRICLDISLTYTGK
jgi:hypothetical protein